jgi:glucose-6-phosphate-specific signal transduction histidine kinase
LGNALVWLVEKESLMLTILYSLIGGLVCLALLEVWWLWQRAEAWKQHSRDWKKVATEWRNNADQWRELYFKCRGSLKEPQEQGE